MKKNKKLFAILTLVAFMMTLVPALAFAAELTNSVAATFELQANGDVKVGPAENYIASSANEKGGSDVEAVSEAGLKTVLAASVDATTYYFAASGAVTAEDTFANAGAQIPEDLVNASAILAEQNEADQIAAYKSATAAVKAAVDAADDNAIKNAVEQADAAIKAAGAVAKGTSGVYVKDGTADARSLSDKNSEAMEFELYL